MKHRLTALIAALFLVLPLSADEPPKHPTVRVLDHEGQPIEGLIFQLYWSDDGSDRFDAITTKRMEPAVAVTDVDGRAAFTMIALEGITKDASVALSPLITVPLVWGDSREKWRRIGERHFELMTNYALDLLYRIDTEHLKSGEAFIQLPEAVRFTFLLNPASDRQTATVQRKGGLFRFAINGGVQELDSFELMIPRGKPAEIGVLYQQYFSILEFSADQTAETQTVKQLATMEPLLKDGAISYTARSWQPQSLPQFMLFSVDGSNAHYFPFHPSQAWDDQGQLLDHRWHIPFPSGEYMLRELPVQNSPLSETWNEGGIFDTLLRLRRGEDLPHLKRITIPEGGTVELSTEDFLAPPTEVPPAEPEAKDAAP